MMLNFKARIETKGCVFGTWVNTPSSSVVEAIGVSGLDFMVIDMEHGPIGLNVAEDMVRACQLRGVQPIIRVDTSADHVLLHALETGAKAIMVPHVSSVESAQKVVDGARYPPDGTRGLSPYTRCHDYTHEGLVNSLQEHNADTFVSVLVEGLEGINNIESIARVEGLDMIYLGSYDISQSIGLPGQLEHPDVLQKRVECVEIIRANNCIAGTFSRDLDDCKVCRDQGFGFVAYVADSFALQAFFAESVSKFTAS